MRNDGCASLRDPFIAVGVVEVPMRVDELSDRLAAKRAQRLFYPWARVGQAGIHQQLTVRSAEHGNVAARSFKHANLAAQAVYSDWCRGRRATHANYNVLRLCEGLSRRQPYARCSGARGHRAAKTEATTVRRESAPAKDAAHDACSFSCVVGQQIARRLPGILGCWTQPRRKPSKSALNCCLWVSARPFGAPG
jgi:hypothetical protein